MIPNILIFLRQKSYWHQGRHRYCTKLDLIFIKQLVKLTFNANANIDYLGNSLVPEY